MFPHRKPALKAREAMRDAAFELGEKASRASDHEKIREVMKEISRITNHDHVRLVSSGNCAIMAAVSAIDGKIMVPDQGGWRGFKDYPRLLGKEICMLKTNLGIIDSEPLEEEIRRHRPRALFVTSFAGYIAEQGIKDIARVCRENGVLLVEDASGAIGDVKLAKGDADVMVCSTGAPKILNLLSGGFISARRKEVLDKSKKIIAACKIDPIICAGMVEELRDSGKRVKTLVEYSSLLKENLEGVVHRGRRGICVGLRVEDPRGFAAMAKRKGLVTDMNEGLLTVCPRYERFLESGVVVELKKLDVLKMNKEDILRMAEILKM